MRSTNEHPASLCGRDLVLGYERQPVVHGARVQVRAGAVTALVGPNGSGKSTVLRALARLHPLNGGEVLVDGHDVRALSAKELARRVTLLAQSRPRPTGLTIRDVVTFGRHPHRSRFASLTDADRAAVDHALEVTGLTPMQQRPVDQLSGGELQRAWLAGCLAQDTAVLLLDEPTNHLDLRYQVETLDLLEDLAHDYGTAIGVVLHDLNHAAAVADEVALLAEGRLLAEGTPADVLTSSALSEAYGLPVEVNPDPHTGCLRVEPRRRSRRHTVPPRGHP